MFGYVFKMLRFLNTSREAHLVALILWLGMTLLQICVANGQTNFISTTTRRSINSESDPWVQCSPVPGAAVTLGRYIDTRNGASNNTEPPTPESDLRGNPPVTVYYSFLDTDDYNSYGSFYCTSTLDGSTITVPIILLRSNAYFVPAIGKFTKTVSAGEMDVTIEMTERPPSNTEKNWRFNGTTDPDDVLYAGPNTTYVIPGPVQPSRGGIYEVHLVGERNTARGGLMRLIVRACPAGRFDVSAGCTGLCESCYNGGVCDDKTGICVCPPGFNGVNCESPCNGSHYGLRCEFPCSINDSSRTACGGLTVCIPDPYGCSCAAGYKGLDCTTECDVGEYGPGCTQTCHCESRQCDRFTGECACASDGCSPGWTGTNCQRCIDGRYGPDCLGTITVNNIPVNEGQETNFTCRISGSKLLSSAPPVLRVYKRRDDIDGRFYNYGITPTSDSAQDMTATYRVETVQYGDVFRCWLRDVNTFRGEETVVDLFILPQLSTSPRVTAMTNNSVTLMWDAWQEGRDVGDGPLVKYNVYFRDPALTQDWTLVSRSDGLASSETIRNLSPDTNYMFAVSAVRQGTGGEGNRTAVAGSTSCSPPSQSPMSLKAYYTTTPRLITVTWENPTLGSNCRTGYTGVKIYYTSSLNTMSIEVPFESPASYDIPSLEVDVLYYIYMTSLNKDSESIRTEVVTVSTVGENPVTAANTIAPVAGAFAGGMLLILLIILIVYILIRFRQRAGPPRRLSQTEVDKSSTNKDKLATTGDKSPRTGDNSPTYENQTSVDAVKDYQGIQLNTGTRISVYTCRKDATSLGDQNPTSPPPPESTYKSLKGMPTRLDDEGYLQPMEGDNPAYEEVHSPTESTYFQPI